jgi:hypothetical protein
MELSQNNVIVGIIMPNNWDESGRVNEIALYTATEEVYVVERKSLTGELMNFLHRCVEIKAKVREQPDGSKSIFAYNYVSLKNCLIDE